VDCFRQVNKLDARKFFTRSASIAPRHFTVSSSAAFLPGNCRFSYNPLLPADEIDGYQSAPDEPTERGFSVQVRRIIYPLSGSRLVAAVNSRETDDENSRPVASSQ